MKKALAILASFGLVATSSFSVIACAQKVDESNINTTLRSLESWFTEAQPKEEAGKTREGKTMVIAVGGRHNSDTLSYLATLNALVNNDWTTNGESLTSKTRVENLDKQMNEFEGTKPSNSWQDSISTNLSTALSTTMNWKDNQNFESDIAKNYLKAQTGEAVMKVEFHTILVDRIEQFWNTTTGRGFLNNILHAQVRDFYQFLANRDATKADNALGIPLSDELIDITSNSFRLGVLTDDKNESLTRIINKKENLGPWFFVVRSGKVIGVKTGFRNYYEFNKEYTDEESAANSLMTSDLAKKTFNEFTLSLGQVLKNGMDFFKNNFINDQRTIKKNDYISKNDQGEAWKTKTSGTSNIAEIDDPRGDGIKKNHDDKTDKDKNKGNNQTPEVKPEEPKEKEKNDKDAPQTDESKKATNIKYHYSFLD